MSTALVIFMKFPQAGAVKTRLGAEVGIEKAALIYQKMLRFVLSEVAAKLPADEFTTYLYCDPYRPEADYQKLLSKDKFKIRMQMGSDLGERMKRALVETLTVHESTIIIGTDCVELTDELLHEARVTLQSGFDVVVGPAEDGGYYLIGMKRPHVGLFEQVAWSTPTVYEDTLRKTKLLGLSTHSLPVLYDVDTQADWNRTTRISLE